LQGEKQVTAMKATFFYQKSIFRS